MIKNKAVALFLLMGSMSLLSMELEEASIDDQIDGLIEYNHRLHEYANFNFCYANNQTMQEHVRVKVAYEIPDCMPIFCTLYKDKNTDFPRIPDCFPLSCLFIDRKQVGAQTIINVIIEGKKHSFKLVKSFNGDASYLFEHKNELKIIIDSQYKNFIKEPDLYPETYKEKVFEELNQKGIIKQCTLKIRLPRRKNGKRKNKRIYRNIHTIVHELKDYLAFMKELSDEKKLLYKLLIAVEKECKDKTSYFSLLPKDVIPMLKNFMQRKWAHLDPLLEYHEQILKEVEQEKKIIQIVQEAYHQ